MGRMHVRGVPVASQMKEPQWKLSDLENLPWSSLPDVEKIPQLVYEKYRGTISYITDFVRLSYEFVQAILTAELNVQHVSTMLVECLMIT